MKQKIHQWHAERGERGNGPGHPRHGGIPSISVGAGKFFWGERFLPEKFSGDYFLLHS